MATEQQLKNLTNRGKGRKHGQLNKATKDTRAAMALIAEGKAASFKAWLERTANGMRERGKDGKPGEWIVKPDPGRAAQIYLAAIEYHIPKLQRTEVTGLNGAAIYVELSQTDGKL